MIEECPCEDCGLSFDTEEMTHCEDGARCEACSDKRWAEVEAEFGWMRKHAADAARAEREGDFETARQITESCGVRYTGPNA